MTVLFAADALTVLVYLNVAQIVGIVILIGILIWIYGIKRQTSAVLIEARNLLQAVKEWTGIGKDARTDVREAAARTEKKADAVAQRTEEIKKAVEEVSVKVDEIRSGPIPPPSGIDLKRPDNLPGLQ